MSLVYLDTHRDQLNSALSETDWSTIISNTPAEAGFANPYGFHYANKLHELLCDIAYGAGKHIDRGPWIARHRDRLLPIFTHIVDTTMAALDARMVAEKPADMSVSEAQRKLAERLYRDDSWPTICDMAVHERLVQDLRTVVDYAADGPGGTGEILSDDPAEWLGNARAWAAAITIAEDPDQVTIARFGNGYRAILLHRPETIRAQSHAMAAAIETLGHPLQDRTSTNLARQFGLLDARGHPIATLYVDDRCLATTECGPHYPGLATVPFELVVSSNARILESEHGIHDLEHAYRQAVPDGEHLLGFQVPDESSFDDESWRVKIRYRDGMVQDESRAAVEIVKTQYRYGGGHLKSHTVEYFRENLRHRDGMPAFFSERKIAWYDHGEETAAMDTVEYYASTRQLAG